MKLVGAVLVGRPGLALRTIGQLLKVSTIMRNSPIFAFYLPGALTPSQVEQIRMLGGNVYVQQISLPLPRYHNREMFFSKSNDYARSFGKSRLGYLDMCFWKTNMFAERELRDSDFVLMFDDDSDFIGSPDDAICRTLEADDWVIASARLKAENISQRVIDTREQMFEFVQNFVDHNKVRVSDNQLASALASKSHFDFHALPWSLGNFNVYRTEAFQQSEWFRWAYSVSLFAGNHRLRWGEIETLGIYAKLYFPNSHLDMGLVVAGEYSPSARGTQLVRRRGIERLLQTARARWNRVPS